MTIVRDWSEKIDRSDGTDQEGCMGDKSVPITSAEGNSSPTVDGS
jgi:hypothetical protein